MYATYEFYIDEFKGNILNTNNFATYEQRAGAFIRFITLQKSDKYTGDELKHCSCAIADKMYKQDTEEEYKHSGISSEKVSEYSVSYLNNSIEEIETQKKKELLEIAKQYLSLTGLLYRGR